MSAPDAERGEEDAPPRDAAMARGYARSRAKNEAIQAQLEPLGFHEGRHTFASLMIAAGVNVAAGVNAKALSTYLGHANISITFDRYGHLMPGNEAEARAQLGAYLDREGG